jgi:hypothetical protein
LQPGRQVLKVDGATASTANKSYGVFKIRVYVTAGKTSVMPYTIWMPKLDMANASTVPSPTTADVAITTPRIPGLELRIPSGSVIRDSEGKAVTQLGITPIPVDRPPFPLPTNVYVPIYFTVQPGGSYILPPRAQIIYPNYMNERAGKRMDFWSYDPDGKDWYIYGQGTVSPDRKQIVPDAGVAIYEAVARSLCPGLLSVAPSGAENPLPMSVCISPVSRNSLMFWLSTSAAGMSH